MAHNEAGDSKASECTDIITCRSPLKAPNKPNKLETAETSKTAITLQWKAPEDPQECRHVDAYVLDKREIGKKSWKNIAKV